MNAEEFERLIAGRERTVDDVAEEPESESYEAPGKRQDSLPRRLTRPVRVSADAGESVDRNVVSYPLYNSFNYSVFFPKSHEAVKVSLGITSPGREEGKTTTVCNLAAALSMGSGRRTVVVDLNLARPRIHEVFGTPRGPGLAEALAGEDICVVPTRLENLFALPIGDARIIQPSKLLAFREILASLFTEFEFVIADMPPTGSGSFPTLIANQLSGLLVVVRSRKTKRRDVSKLLRRVREEKVLGFVINGIEESDF